MRSGFMLLLLATLLANCMSRPTERIDLAKARTSLRLEDGSTISLPGYSDYSPVLVRSPSNTVILAFISNRPNAVAGYVSGNHYIYLTESVEPYFGFGELPAFTAPVAVQHSGAPLNVVADSAIVATWIEGNLNLFVNRFAGITALSFASADISTGIVTFTPDPLPNSARSSDMLLDARYKEAKIISRSGSNVYKSAIGTVDSGTPVTNPLLAGADSISPASSLASGYSDAYFIASGGLLYTGTLDSDFGEHPEFNAALASNGLYLTSVAQMQTYLGAANPIVFSATDTSGEQDMYFVISHDATSLWLLTFNFGFAPEPNPGPYRVFVTQTAYDGGFGSLYVADYYCSQDSRAPDLNVPYKAMLVDGSQRIASITANVGDGQTDWVFQPSASYTQAASGAAIGTAGANGLLTFPLSAAFSSSAEVAWTGMNNSWVATGSDCQDWQSSMGSDVGERGATNVTGSAVLQDTTASMCNNTFKLYCVEQPF
ncbi:MAG TPA: DUF1554 domain-containing protein [Turneriella sp.]|nr:DUF1554 domain-containing protein [Turneriella sp.]